METAHTSSHLAKLALRGRNSTPRHTVQLITNLTALTYLPNSYSCARHPYISWPRESADRDVLPPRAAFIWCTATNMAVSEGIGSLLSSSTAAMRGLKVALALTVMCVALVAGIVRSVFSRSAFPFCWIKIALRRIPAPSSNGVSTHVLRSFFGRRGCEVYWVTFCSSWVGSRIVSNCVHLIASAAQQCGGSRGMTMHFFLLLYAVHGYAL